MGGILVGGVFIVFGDGFEGRGLGAGAGIDDGVPLGRIIDGCLELGCDFSGGDVLRTG